MSIALRPYRADDLDAVIAVFQSAVRDVASRDYDLAQVAAWSTVDRDRWAKKRGSARTWLAEVDGVVAGFADLTADGLIDMMFVDGAHQGMRVATTLLEAIEMAARGDGLSSLRTEASLTARGFFERHDFVVLDAQTVESRGQRFRNFRMEKRLA